MRKVKRWHFWLSFIFALWLAASAVMIHATARGGLNQACCDRIRLGMTFSEVRELLEDNSRECRSVTRMPFSNADFTSWYDDDRNRITVGFDRIGGGVTEKEFHATDLSFFERLKRRVKRHVQALRQ
jgi:hypothetical protein